MKINHYILFLFALTIATDTLSQRRSRNPAPVIITYDDSLYNAMEWRNIGPFRGGRSTTSSGVVGDPMTYYFGSVGGGVWKTVDAGLSWKNISDKFFEATSIGAIAVAESDPNVIYVGTGEACIRGVMTSHGDGVYKSTDAGQTWKHIGLEKTMQISEIRIHPKNPDMVYVAAQGSPYAPTQDRGIYRSSNGGGSWEKIHFVNNTSGVNNLSMDMNNPRILYASYWDHQRKPWFVRSGGPGSGIWKSMDSGDTWEKLTDGLPKAVMGKIGVAVSRANSNRVYAIIESEEGGLYRSDDKGKKWKLINKQRILRTRSWYYMHVFADPKNEDVVYVLNAPFNKSIDGGKTFTQVTVPHGDNHDLWINPDDPKNMINSNDGGANISFDGAKSWSTQRNQPTAQFYRVNADNRFPYWLYAGQQDNSTLTIPSRTDGGGIGWQDWVANVGGGEAAHIAFDPDDPTYIYSTTITGFIDQYNLKTGKQKAIKPYPVFDLGEPSDEMKYRYNWNPPVIVSRHNPTTIYFGSNIIHKSTNRGNSWEEVSPDLTMNDSTKLGLMGGPITNEAAGGETYHTLMTLADSPHDAQTIWAGADDGFLHSTTDGGQNWQNVSPGPEGIINSIEVSSHDPATVYITLMRYKFDDFKPYIYKTTNNGQNWSLITNGIPVGAFARVVREDPAKKDLLYCGTERGMYISFDGGNVWKKFQLKLPMVPITDLKVHQNDLLAATHGRAFWILDDLTPLHQLNAEMASSQVFLYKPKEVVKTNTGSQSQNSQIGKNPYPGASIKYYLKEVSEEDSVELVLEIMDAQNVLIRTLSSDSKNKTDKIPKKKGMNVAKWDLRVNSLEPAEGVMMPPGVKFLPGHQVSLGTYTAKLTYGDYELAQQFTVVRDPRDEATAIQIVEKQSTVKSIYNDINNLYKSLKQLQEVREQVGRMKNRLEDDEEVQEKGGEIEKSIEEVEKELISPKQETFQDIINFRNKLDRQLYNLMQTIDSNVPPVTKGEKELYLELQQQWSELYKYVEKILVDDVANFNKLLREKGVEYIAPKEKKKKGEV